jgi:hypothetical protein
MVDVLIVVAVGTVGAVAEVIFAVHVIDVKR